MRRLWAWLARWEAGLAEIEGRMTPEQRAFAYWLDRGGFLL